MARDLRSPDQSSEIEPTSCLDASRECSSRGAWHDMPQVPPIGWFWGKDLSTGEEKLVAYSGGHDATFRDMSGNLFLPDVWRPAQGTAARSDETGTGSAEGNGPVAEGHALRELPEEIARAMEALEDAAQEHGWEAGSGSAENTARAANDRRVAREALTTAILSRLTAAEASREAAIQERDEAQRKWAEANALLASILAHPEGQG